MQYLEVNRNIFDMPKDYLFIHSISADFNMYYNSMARDINRIYGVKRVLTSRYPNFINKFEPGNFLCDINQTKNRTIITIIVKAKIADLTDLYQIKRSFEAIKSVCADLHISKIALPNKLNDPALDPRDVEKLINEIFNDTDIEIIVCK